MFPCFRFKPQLLRTVVGTLYIRASMSSLPPSSLAGSPVSALCPPGQCQFGQDALAVPLLSRTPVSPTSSVLRFGLPDTSAPLKLSTCACILAQSQIHGETVVRPYTPISTNQDIGYFDLLVKNYGPDGKMSRHMHEIEPGKDTISFRHIDFNVKIQAPFDDTDHILMLVGGTGITPMIQALHDILGRKNDDNNNKRKPKVTMLYGSRVSDDILGKELLDAWSLSHPEQLEVIHVLSQEPKNSKSTAVRGFINQSLISKYFPFAPSVASLKLRVFVCGPPLMYDALCGPRNEPDKLSGVLYDMGFTPEQVYKF